MGLTRLFLSVKSGLQSGADLIIKSQMEFRNSRKVKMSSGVRVGGSPKGEDLGVCCELRGWRSFWGLIGRWVDF